MICGKKVRIPPTPPITASTMRLWVQNGASAATNRCRTAGAIWPLISHSTAALSPSPTGPNTTENIRNITNKKMGSASTRLVTMRSILSDWVIKPGVVFFTTVLPTSSVM